MLCMALQPLPALAAENGGTVLQSAGVTAVLETSLSTEEYIQLAAQAQGASYGYTNIGISNISDELLNVRAVPALDGKLVGKMPRGAACEVLDTADGWAHIQSGEVEGYVSLDYLLTGPDAKLMANDLVRTVAVANTDGLNVRENPDTNSPVVMQIRQGEELDYLETIDGWVKVAVDSDEVYVSAEYVDVVTKLDTAITMTELLYGAGVSDVRVDLTEYAKQFLGNPYVWGGTSLTNGADCSGFVLSIFAKYGISMPRVAAAQATVGTSISADQLLPGDLIFYGKGGYINHVAIYIGGGQVIHASTERTGIKISNYNYRTPVKYVRVLQD
ncbi:MAG: SH3 domain-containing protein [Lachnospiraceae bacterium]|nr:SH3 domain-containing protein [Lachnospiraceae bacterium]MCI9650833.1 SH3 domain-containing protein [Lachnospiraceae bacterium]